MGKVYPHIDERLSEWMLTQHMFFVATAPLEDDGHVNVSPKGLAGSFAVLGPHTVAYRDFTGSGIETVAHLRENGRIVVMFCAFDGPPKIVRLHGRGDVLLPDEARFAEVAPCFGEQPVGVRCIVSVEVERVSDSCGWGVPLMDYRAQRQTLPRNATRNGEAFLAQYRRESNATSIDDLPGFPAAKPLTPHA